MNCKYMDTKLFHSYIPGRNCIATAIGSLFKYNGWFDLSESQIWLFMGGTPILSFSCHDVHNPRIACAHYPIREYLLEHLSVELSDEVYAEGSAQRKFIEKIADNKPAIVKVDLFFIPQYRYFFRKKHSTHFLTLVGFDKKNFKFLDSAYDSQVLSISFSDFSQAFHSEAKTTNFKRSLSFEFHQVSTQPNHLNYKNAIHRALNISSLSKYYNNDSILLGEEAAYALIDYLSLPESRPHYEDLGFQLLRPEGPSYTFSLFFCCLENYYLEHLNDFLLTKIPKLKIMWKNIGLAILRSGKSERSANGIFPAIEEAASVTEKVVSEIKILGWYDHSRRSNSY
jgi:hypothetical protein